MTFTEAIVGCAHSPTDSPEVLDRSRRGRHTGQAYSDSSLDYWMFRLDVVEPGYSTELAVLSLVGLFGQIGPTSLLEFTLT